MSWDSYGLCECGYFERTSFGDPFFWPDVCPGCGKWPGRGYGDDAWKLVVGRRKGLLGNKLEIKDD